MRARTVLILLALLSGVAVTIVALFGTQAPPATATAPVAAPSVVVATVPIQTGELIKPTALSFAPKTGDLPSTGTFNRPLAARPEEQEEADHKAINEITGSVARHRFDPGDPIGRASVVKPGDSGFLAAVLQPGMRAITIGVTPVTGTGGLIYPGDRVDIILTQTFPATDSNLGRRSVGETVADNLRVLAIDQQLQVTAPPNGEGKLARTVTVEVEPREAEKIEVATKLGELSLTIRSLDANPGDMANATPAIWAEDVSPALKVTADRPKEQPPGAAAPAAGAGPAVMVIRGDKADQGGVH
jgi:pilus assembly protein CpaB